MELHSVALRDTLIHTLRELVSHTEGVYLSLARQYPVLIKEMERSMDHSSVLIGSLTTEDAVSTADTASSVAAAVQTAEHILGDAGEHFTRILHEDAGLFQAMEEGIDHLARLERLIEQIRVDSEQMELISLNALTVALKAGTSGRAFSFITEDLQQIASRTIELTRDTTSKGTQVSELFRTFRREVTEARSSEETLFQEITPLLQQQLAAFTDGISQVQDLFQSIRKNSTSIKEPLMAIMQEIQQQDIIKQSVDHVIMTLEQMSDSTDSADQDALLDELTFLIALPDLARKVLDEVYERIEQSLQVFDSQSKKAHEIMHQVEESRRSQLDSLLSGDHSTLLADWYSRTESVLHELFQRLRAALHRKETLSHDSRDLVQSVFHIEHNFAAFQTLIDRFHNINMASRIEVAKSDVLGSMSGTIEEMNSLTDQITLDVEQAISSVQEFIQGTNTAITTYRRMIDDQKTRIESHFSRIRTGFSGMHRAQSELSTQAADFSLFTHSFENLFETTQQDLQGLRTLLQDLDMIYATLDQVKQEAYEHRRGILKRIGREDWNIESAKLSQLIERFTIYTHKKAAGESGGFSIDDETADSGEVTLF